MKAIVYHEYGMPDVLRCEEVPKPVPKPDQVLIKVRAASVNPLDWRFMKGEPALMRVFIGLRKPRMNRPGIDLAGEVEAVGSKVTQFKPGDAVFGSGRGTFAEYVSTTESRIAIKPEPVTFVQAASINVAGLTAIQGLRDHGKVQAGQRVLINGASGGVGTFAVQLARVFGAHVTGVCSTRNLELVKSIGADEVVDYTRTNFAQGNRRYDFIFDCVGNHTYSECRRVLNPTGRYIGIGAPHDASLIALLIPAIRDVVLSIFRKQKSVMFIAKASQKDLSLLGELVASGELKPVIDKTYRLSDAAAAVGHVEQGHARGKVIIEVW
jgi:NADPH:quinone reductase-like Zn-dependent oxidoreductase